MGHGFVWYSEGAYQGHTLSLGTRGPKPRSSSTTDTHPRTFLVLGLDADRDSLLVRHGAGGHDEYTFGSLRCFSGAYASWGPPGFSSGRDWPPASGRADGEGAVLDDFTSSTPIPIAKAETVAGLWEGVVEQTGWDPYPMTLALRPLENGAGPIEGETRYPRWNCVARNPLVGFQGDDVILEELISRGTCRDGYVRLHRNADETLDWTWRAREGGDAARATLTRVGTP